MKIKDRLFMMKINWKLACYMRQHKRNIMKYCHTGHHKLQRKTETFKFGRNRAIKFEYLSCKYCHYKFFVTKKKKDEWITTNLKFNKYNNTAYKQIVEKYISHIND